MSDIQVTKDTKISTVVLQPILESIPESIPEIVSESVVSSVPSLPEVVTELSTAVEDAVVPTPVETVETVEKVAASVVLVNPNGLLTKMEELTKYIKSTMGTSKLTLLNIMSILTNLMQIVEQYNNLTGSQKQMLVIDALKQVINEQYSITNLDDLAEKYILFNLIDNALPKIITALVASINGEIKFVKKNESKILSFFGKLFCCK
jgi:hypothetical protein